VFCFFGWGLAISVMFLSIFLWIGDWELMYGVGVVGIGVEFNTREERDSFFQFYAMVTVIISRQGKLLV
jgi:hypothetical protein